MERQVPFFLGYPAHMTRTHAKQIAPSFSFPLLSASAFAFVQDSIRWGGANIGSTMRRGEKDQAIAFLNR